jgi:hypothetical protein
MIDHIAVTYNLGREDAYLLCSLVVDLKSSEIVDGGQYIVSALLPEAIFSKPSTPANAEAFRRDALTLSSEQPAGERAVSASLAVDRTA